MHYTNTHTYTQEAPAFLTEVNLKVGNSLPPVKEIEKTAPVPKKTVSGQAADLPSFLSEVSPVLKKVGVKGEKEEEGEDKSALGLLVALKVCIIFILWRIISRA